MDTTAALVAEHGLTSVTMSQIAKESGIGRATLYKYFPDVEAILLAWHERQISDHLGHLAEVRERAGAPGEQLEAVLEAFALISHESRGHRDTELAGLLHRDQHVTKAEQQLHGMIQDLVTEGVRAGHLRDDIAPGELATYCLHALTAAAATCPPRPRSTDSSRSPWPGCAPMRLLPIPSEPESAPAVPAEPPVPPRSSHCMPHGTTRRVVTSRPIHNQADNSRAHAEPTAARRPLPIRAGHSRPQTRLNEHGAPAALPSGRGDAFGRISTLAIRQGGRMPRRPEKSGTPGSAGGGRP